MIEMSDVECRKSSVFKHGTFPAINIVSCKMVTRYRVRLKTHVKVKIVATVASIALIVTLLGLYIFDSDVDEATFDYYFTAVVIEPPTFEAPKRGSSPGNRWISYPYFAVVKAGEEIYSVGSFKYLAEGSVVCIGALVKRNKSEILNYVNVESANCS